MTTHSTNNYPLPVRAENALQLRLEASSDPVIRGFPMLVAATFENRSVDRGFGNIPCLNEGFFVGPSTSTLRFRGHDGVVTRVDTLDPSAAGEAESFQLAPGEQRRFLVDMMLHVVDLPAGKYDVLLTVDEHERGDALASQFAFSLIEPSDTEAKLREAWFHPALGRALLTWDEFLSASFTPVQSHDISEGAERSVAFYRFIHFAVHGPKVIAAQEVSALLQLRDRVEVAELTVLEHEVLTARGANDAASELKARIGERWPGLMESVQLNEQGRGFLSEMRRRSGAERRRAQRDVPVPYRSDPPPR